MNRRRKRIFRSGWHSGLTLIEVVAGMAIAGTLLVSVILSTSVHRRQVKRAMLKQEAIVALDRLLCAWAAEDFRSTEFDRLATSGGFYPRNGLVGPGGRDGRFELTLQSVGSYREISMETVRLECFSSGGSSPLTSVEIARPIQRLMQ